MQLFDSKQAPNPRRVRIFMAEKGITCDTVQVDIMSGENIDEAFLAINPRGVLRSTSRIAITGDCMRAMPAIMALWRTPASRRVIDVPRRSRNRMEYVAAMVAAPIVSAVWIPVMAGVGRPSPVSLIRFLRKGW